MGANRSYYISLVRGLTGYYVKVLATDIDVVRGYASKYYGKLWCSVYTDTDMNVMKDKFTNFEFNVINEDHPVILNDNPSYE